MLNIVCAKSLEMGVKEREETQVTSELVVWMESSIIKNEWKCITLLF